VSHLITMHSGIMTTVLNNLCVLNGAGRKNRGFTLVELLLAIFIFSIVVSTVYGSYRVTFHLVHSTEQTMATDGRALVVLDRITEDLSSLVQTNGGRFTGEQHENSGMRGDSLSFVSAVHIGLTKRDDLGGYSLVEYSVEEDENTGLLKLYRSGTSLLPGADENGIEAIKYLLCDGLKEVKFSYFNDEGVESEEWWSQEDEFATENQSFPVKVVVVLQFSESLESEQISLFTTSVALPRTGE
jgi:general secretion pathway protein J